MSIRQILMVWEHDFSHSEQSVMLALADHAHEDGKEIRPSLERISWKTGYDKRHVRRILNGLKAKGIVVVEKPSTNKSPATLSFDWKKANKKPTFEEHLKTLRGHFTPSSEDISPPQSRADILPPQATQRGHFTPSREDISPPLEGVWVSPDPLGNRQLTKREDKKEKSDRTSSPIKKVAEVEKPSPPVEVEKPSKTWGSSGDGARFESQYTEKPTEKPWYGGGTRNNPELAEGFTEYMKMAWWPSSWQNGKGYEFMPAFLKYLRFADPGNPVKYPEGLNQFIEVKGWWKQFQSGKEAENAPPPEKFIVDRGEFATNQFFADVYGDIFIGDAEKLFRSGVKSIVVTGIKQNSKAFAVDVLKDGEEDRIIIERNRFSTNYQDFKRSA